MIERHVTFEVYKDKAEEFIKLFIDEYKPAMATMPGFINVELLQNQNQTHQFRMVIRFETNDAAAGWRNSQAHESLKPRIKPLYETSSVDVFDFVN